MDPRERANALLTRAGARDGVVTPDNMTSPMDAANTQQIPGAVVAHLDREADPESTGEVAASVIEEQDSHLAASTPTKPLNAPAGDAVEVREEEGLLPTTRTVSSTSTFASRLDGAPAARPAAQDEEIEEREEDGLIPTTRTVRRKSEFARRLEDL